MKHEDFIGLKKKYDSCCQLFYKREELLRTIEVIKTQQTRIKIECGNERWARDVYINDENTLEKIKNLLIEGYESQLKEVEKQIENL